MSKSVTCHNCKNQPAQLGFSRCAECRAARRAADKQRRRDAAELLFPPTVRTKLLTMLSVGVALGEACADLGVSAPMVHGWRQYSPTWSASLDAALMEGRDPSLDHGTPDAYRWGLCRCPDCRSAKRTAGDWDRVS